MAAVAKKIHFAFDFGERVWLVCDLASSGIVDGYRIYKMRRMCRERLDCKLPMGDGERADSK